jgi:tripartite-type tricarboxylate transporter receptor subunit TctC
VGGGITDTLAIVKAAPDGNAVGIVSNDHAVNPSVFNRIPYDGIADLTQISVIGSSSFVLVVNPAKVSARNAKELQVFLRAKPGGYNYGSSGNGTIIHLAGEMYMEAAGAEVRHIPYKGMGPMLADLIGGQIEVGVGAVPAVQGHLKAGTRRAIGVMASSVSHRFPTCRPWPNRASRGWTWKVGSPS